MMATWLIFDAMDRFLPNGALDEGRAAPPGRRLARLLRREVLSAAELLFLRLSIAPEHFQAGGAGLDLARTHGQIV